MQIPIRDILSGELRGTVQLPEGYHRVLRGMSRLGDMHLNERKFVAGETEWLPVPEENIGDKVGGYFEAYTLLIRPGPQPDKECPICRVRAVKPGFRFCWSCCYDVIKA